jgi:catechol 2,3-dioxygenase-like lactoylglutathione lyase family enzyme
MKRIILMLPLVLAYATALRAQLSSPNSSGVAMGHLHYTVEDVDANRKFWIALGGKPVRTGATEVLKFPDTLVFLSRGKASAGTEGSVVNHVAFRIESLAKLEAAGIKVEYNRDYAGVASVFSPDGERIELFDATATNLTFTPEDGRDDPIARRHNQKITVPIIAHHIHIYVPAGSELRAKDWYSATFGGLPGKRWRYDAVDLPGINLNFSGSPQALAPLKGRRLDHVGFEVADLEAFCKKLEARGVKFDVPYTKQLSGLASAFLTDPWGTYIELTEGLNRLYK